MAATTIAIVVPIPGAPGQRLDRLRRLFAGEDGGAMRPHIPLVGPFDAEPSFLPLEQHCWDVCHKTAAFWVELGAPEVDAGERLVYAGVRSGGDELMALREALLTGRYAPPPSDGAFDPRAVIARIEPDEDIALAQRETAGLEPVGSFLMERIDLMARYPDGSWYQRDFYTLDRAVAEA
ncbi:MAG: 2'-5' RNA ligase family protein [Dehalococcoidia bacterium]